METQEIKLIKESWKLILGNPFSAGLLFYVRFFAMSPELRPLYKVDHHFHVLAKELTGIVARVLDGLDNIDDIIKYVESHARRLVKYGVTDAHYSIAGNSLIWTFEMSLGRLFTAEVRSAWLKCYSILSTAMINASRVTEQPKV